jgi:membrane protein DedA with SNARE-associated domain
MLVLASVSDSLVNVAVHIIRDLGLPGIFLLMAFDATGIPFPSEATMMFAGFNVFEGHHSLVTICIAGILGDLAGASLAYAIGYFGRVELLERHGGKLHLTARRMELAEGWFERYGARAILISRNLPIVRTFISFPAGAVRMPYPRFALMTFLGVIPWVVGFAVLGHAVGSKWNSWRHHLAYLDYAAAALIVAAIVYLVIRRRRRPPEVETAVDATS